MCYLKQCFKFHPNQWYECKNYDNYHAQCKDFIQWSELFSSYNTQLKLTPDMRKLLHIIKQPLWTMHDNENIYYWTPMAYFGEMTWKLNHRLSFCELNGTNCLPCLPPLQPETASNCYQHCNTCQNLWRHNGLNLYF